MSQAPSTKATLPFVLSSSISRLSWTTSLFLFSSSILHPDTPAVPALRQVAPLCQAFSFCEYLRYRTASFVTCRGTGPIITLRPFVLTLITTRDPRTATNSVQRSPSRLVNPLVCFHLPVPSVFAYSLRRVFNQANDNFSFDDKAALEFPDNN